MARRVFYSFHYDSDCWRTQQVRNIGMIEGSKPVSANEWEQVKKGGDSAIEKWITDQLSGRSCTVVLVGSETANRRWVRHEIVESWNSKKGVVGIRIHNLKDSDGTQSPSGPNPFDRIMLGSGDKKLSTLVNLYTFSSSDSTAIYSSIKNNIADWIDEGIRIRNEN
jgi:hypothetical protein